MLWYNVAILNVLLVVLEEAVISVGYVNFNYSHYFKYNYSHRLVKIY